VLAPAHIRRPGAELALEVASQCAAEERLRVFDQSALATARTFLKKYTMAAEKGFDVRGLDEFARALVPLGDEQPGSCIVQADASVGITAFTPGRTDILAAMSVGGISPQTETTEENDDLDSDERKDRRTTRFVSRNGRVSDGDPTIPAHQATERTHRRTGGALPAVDWSLVLGLFNRFEFWGWFVWVVTRRR
jgi:hypothetical protein